VIRPDSKFQGSVQNGSGTAGTQKSKGNIGTSNSIPQDRVVGKPHFADGGRGMGSANIPSILTSYLSIMGVFPILTYYIEKLLLRRKIG
jgi:hypothetical protein